MGTKLEDGIQKCQSLSLQKEMELIERIHIVYQGIKELITLYKPQVMGVETLYFNKNITTAISVADIDAYVIVSGARKDAIAIRKLIH